MMMIGRAHRAALPPPSAERLCLSDLLFIYGEATPRNSRHSLRKVEGGCTVRQALPHCGAASRNGKLARLVLV